MSSFDEILTIFSDEDTRYGTDKNTVHSYGKIYDMLFKNMPHLTSLLEIGFDSGASLLAYAEYFTNAIITGLDIQDNRHPQVLSHSRIRTIIGDATQDNIISSFKTSFDIIIEDASHILFYQVKHFHDYNHLVTPGGLYIIEDVAENNMENLKEHLKDAAEEYKFDMFIVDLRNQKNRFDDILFVFVKRIETPSEHYQSILHYLKDISQTI